MDSAELATARLKETRLGDWLRAQRSVLVGYSGGVDSTYLAVVAREVLGRDNVVRILRLGIKQGRFRDSIDVDEVATLMVDLQLAFFVLHDRGPDREQKLARRGSAAFDLVLNGLLVS